MAGTNAIGTGAVILTANADKLASGLDKAAKDVGKFAQKADAQAKKASGGAGGGGGGILGTMLGVAGGIGLAAVSGKVVNFVSELFGDLQGRAAKVQLAPDVRDGVNRADQQVRQLSNTFDTVLLMAVSKIAPAIEKITPAVEAALFIAEGLFEVAADMIGDVVNAVAEWIGATEAIGNTTDAAGNVIFGAMKQVAVVVGNVWDTMKAGGVVIVSTAGTIVSAFGQAAKAIGQVIQLYDDVWNEVGNLANGPSGPNALAENFRRWGDEVKGLGQGIQGWAAKEIGGWMGGAEVAAKLDGWIDRIQNRFQNRVKVAAVGMEPPKLAGAFERGSKDAYSIVSKYQVQNGGPDNDARKQLNAIEAVRRAIKDGFAELNRADILKVVG